MSALKIAYISPEVVPFAKTGGLADVAGALPKALVEMGNNVKVFMPLYSITDRSKYGITCREKNLNIDIAGKMQSFDLYHCRLDGSECDYYFINIAKYFYRDGMYISSQSGKDWEDNDERFIAFSRAVLKSLMVLDMKPDIIHCNDWQTGLIPAYLKCSEGEYDYFKQSKTIFTIHNIAYQGLFPAHSFYKLGIDRKWFYPTSGFEYYGKVSFLKAGLQFADILTTVSEKYAEEIQSSPEYGYGMEGVLRERSEDLYGVVNGIDYSIWDPATDKLIKANYNFRNLEGKKRNKNALRRLTKLPLVHRDVPLIGVISRLTDQKGFDIFVEVAEQVFELDLQMVILGTGDEKRENQLKELARKYPKKLSVNIRFDNKLAHLIEAGADMFLMPSRYEPCGLNQLYSLKYGTVPIVRETGGLADTIENCNPSKKTGTGFLFKNYDSWEFLNAIRFAMEVYKNKTVWKELMRRGMEKNFSWENSAVKYMRVYQKAMSKQDVGSRLI